MFNYNTTNDKCGLENIDLMILLATLRSPKHRSHVFRVEPFYERTSIPLVHRSQVTAQSPTAAIICETVAVLSSRRAWAGRSTSPLLC